MSEKFPSGPCGHLRKVSISAKAGVLQSTVTAQLVPSSGNSKKRWSILQSISFGGQGNCFCLVLFCSSSAQPLLGQRGGLGTAASACVSLGLKQALLCKEALFWDSLVPFSATSKKKKTKPKESKKICWDPKTELTAVKRHINLRWDCQVKGKQNNLYFWAFAVDLILKCSDPQWISHRGAAGRLVFLSPFSWAHWSSWFRHCSVKPPAIGGWLTLCVECGIWGRYSPFWNCLQVLSCSVKP